MNQKAASTATTPNHSFPRLGLVLWRFALTQNLHGTCADLSMRQMAILLHVYLGDGPHTVGSLCAELRIPKAAASRAVDALTLRGLVRRHRQEEDRRKVMIQRTMKGMVAMNEVSDHMVEASRLTQAMAAQNQAA
jgi:DNA-binding MarR family transcriptional regulator